MKDCVIYFVKYPDPGKVKTRLASGNTPEQAAGFYRLFARDKLMELSAGTNADIWVFYAPDDAGDRMVDWLGPQPKYVPQVGNDIGERMKNAFELVFTSDRRCNYDRAVLVGSDIPGLTPAILRDGLELISPESPTLGPSVDGGYYLIGFHREGFAPETFSDIPWSTPDVRRATYARLSGRGKNIIILPELRDTDTPEDLQYHIDSNAFSGEVRIYAQRLLAISAP